MKGVKGFKIVKRKRKFIWPLSWLFRVMTPKKVYVNLVSRTGIVRQVEVQVGNLYLTAHRNVEFTNEQDCIFYQLIRYRGSKEDVKQLEDTEDSVRLSK